MVTTRFGTDGVRGVANVELTPELVLALGRAVARTISAATFLIGRDTRRSGPLLQAALSAGLASEGADVVDVGVLPTPALAWLSAERDVPAVVISASHNPFADNGIKLFAAGGAKLSEEMEAAIEDELDRVLDPSAKGPRRLEGHGVGGLSAEPGSGPGLRRPPGVVAGGAPAGRPPAGRRQRQRIGLGPGRRALRAAGGRGGRHRLRARRHQHQRRVRLHLDRTPWPAPWWSTRPTSAWPSTVMPTGCWPSDHDGALVNGDELIALFALDLAERGQLAGNTVVVTVMTNLGFRLAMEERGIIVKETAVGDRYVLAALDTDGLSLGGEQSGHIIFRRLATTGDGLLTGLILADLVARSGRPLTELLDGLVTRVPQVLINVPRPQHRAVGRGGGRVVGGGRRGGPAGRRAGGCSCARAAPSRWSG